MMPSQGSEAEDKLRVADTLTLQYTVHIIAFIFYIDEQCSLVRSDFY